MILPAHGGQVGFNPVAVAVGVKELTVLNQLADIQNLVHRHFSPCLEFSRVIHTIIFL